MYSTKKIRQSQFPFEKFSTTFNVGLDQENLIQFFTSLSPSTDGVTLPTKEGEGFSISTEKVENKEVNNILSQIRDIDHLSFGEIKNWNVTYYPPTKYSSKKKFAIPELTIPEAKFGTAIRYIINLSDYSEILHCTIPRFSWEKKIRLVRNKAISITIPICNITQNFFKNVQGESILLFEKGHRPKPIKKFPENRHILVLDGQATFEFIKARLKQFAESYDMDLDSFVKSLNPKWSEGLNFGSESTSATTV